MQKYFIMETTTGKIGVIHDGSFVYRLILNCTTEFSGLQHEKFPLVKDRLEQYFNGKPTSFADIPVYLQSIRGNFSRKVLEETRKIPWGKLVSYRELAKAAGSPKAARAVGNCMSKNPVPIIVPCHRVVKSDGSLGGFTGGLDIKKKLLKLENIKY